MSFGTLPIGQQFQFEGKTYTKATPLLAEANDGSGRRMIPRSAQVEVIGESVTAPIDDRRRFTLSEIVSALESATAKLAADASVDDGCRTKLDTLRQQVIEQLQHR